MLYIDGPLPYLIETDEDDETALALLSLSAPSIPPSARHDAPSGIDPTRTYAIAKAFRRLLVQYNIFASSNANATTRDRYALQIQRMMTGNHERFSAAVGFPSIDHMFIHHLHDFLLIHDMSGARKTKGDYQGFGQAALNILKKWLRVPDKKEVLCNLYRHAVTLALAEQ